ncbi:MAG: late competence development ComFB family protein [Oscillospiraceae bacterium]|nr:late competence development ComFB family protein [Oscillospiraceae bacterium]
MPKQGSKSGKSSKTARVLNLLTDPEAVESPEGQEPQKEAAEGPKLADDRKTQAKIRGALEGALEQELAETAAPTRPKRPKSIKEPVEPEEPVREVTKPLPSPVSAVSPKLEEFSADDSAPGDVIPLPREEHSPLEHAVNELRSAGEKQPDDFICYNVMQALVEDKTDKYIRMFGLCSCPRCRIDVIALALSNLPAKYVVAKPHELIPRLSIYEQKFSAAVVTQVMSACRKVLERPHHKREQG